MWGTMTTSKPSSGRTSLHMEGTSRTMSRPGGSAMGSWQQISLVRSYVLCPLTYLGASRHINSVSWPFLLLVAADTLGFTTYPPAYLSPQASGKNLLIGANFASAGSGLYDETSYLSVSLWKPSNESADIAHGNEWLQISLPIFLMFHAACHSTNSAAGVLQGVPI